VKQILKRAIGTTLFRSTDPLELHPREGSILHGQSSRSYGTAKIFLNGAWHNCTIELTSFSGAKQRCENPHTASWARYGGRGILFKFVSFEQFLEHIGLKPAPELTLDRINVNGHYEPGNVRWADWVTQANNRAAKELHEFSDAELAAELARRWSETKGITRNNGAGDPIPMKTHQPDLSAPAPRGK